jgi:hypothetical protein
VPECVAYPRLQQPRTMINPFLGAHIILDIPWCEARHIRTTSNHFPRVYLWSSCWRLNCHPTQEVRENHIYYINSEFVTQR